MQQRARRRQPQPVTQPHRHRLQPVQHRLQIGLPDVATINDPQRQHLVRRQQVQQGLHVLAATDGVQMQPRHRKIRRQPGILFQRSEIRGQQHLDAHALEVVIGQVQRMLPVRRQLGHQNRLVDLHPFHPCIGQHLQQLGIHRQQPRQQRQTVQIGMRRITHLAQRQIADRPQQHRLGCHALRPGLGQLRQNPRRIQPEGRVGAKLRHDVVIVGVEPLGHLAGGHTGLDIMRAGRTATGGLVDGTFRQRGILPQRRSHGLAVLSCRLGTRRRTPPRHPEVVIQVITGIATHPRRQVAQREAHVQHLVVEREIPHRHPVQTRLVLPVTAAQLRADLLKRLARGLAPPIGLQREFQFPPCANARKPQGMRACHDLLHALPISRTAW